MRSNSRDCWIHTFFFVSLASLLAFANIHSSPITRHYVVRTSRVRDRISNEYDRAEGQDWDRPYRRWAFSSLVRTSKHSNLFHEIERYHRLAEMYKLIYFDIDNPSFPQQARHPLASNLFASIRDHSYTRCQIISLKISNSVCVLPRIVQRKTPISSVFVEYSLTIIYQARMQNNILLM